MTPRSSLTSRVRSDFADFAESATASGIQAGAVKAAEQVAALASAGEWGRPFTQALAELREWYRLASETRGGKQTRRDPLADLLDSIPDTPAGLL